jgi:hypothetical protein
MTGWNRKAGKAKFGRRMAHLMEGGPFAKLGKANTQRAVPLINWKGEKF